MRAFVAMELPERVLESLVQFQGELRQTGSDLKPVERENMHFTVRFLGEISDSQAAQAGSRLEALRLKGVDVEMAGGGAFRAARRRRVVGAGVAEGDRPAVEEIAGAVREALQGIGEKADRPFQPHITLARVRSPRNSGELGALLRRSPLREFGWARLGELKLKSSQLTPSGPVYSDVGVYPLG